MVHLVGGYERFRSVNTAYLAGDLSGGKFPHSQTAPLGQDGYMRLLSLPSILHAWWLVARETTTCTVY